MLTAELAAREAIAAAATAQKVARLASAEALEATARAATAAASARNEGSFLLDEVRCNVSGKQGGIGLVTGNGKFYCMRSAQTLLVRVISAAWIICYTPSRHYIL